MLAEISLELKVFARVLVIEVGAEVEQFDKDGFPDLVEFFKFFIVVGVEIRQLIADLIMIGYILVPGECVDTVAVCDESGAPVILVKSIQIGKSKMCLGPTDEVFCFGAYLKGLQQDSLRRLKRLPALFRPKTDLVFTGFLVLPVDINIDVSGQDQ